MGVLRIVATVPLPDDPFEAAGVLKGVDADYRAFKAAVEKISGAVIEHAAGGRRVRRKVEEPKRRGRAPKIDTMAAAREAGLVQ